MTNSPLVFPANIVATMKAALETAVEHINVDRRTTATKVKMAERIIEMATDGVTNTDELVEAAVREGIRKVA